MSRSFSILALTLAIAFGGIAYSTVDATAKNYVETGDRLSTAQDLEWYLGRFPYSVGAK